MGHSQTWLYRLDRLIAAIIASAQWLALPLILLLFLQWPLRDVVHAYSGRKPTISGKLFLHFSGGEHQRATPTGTHSSRTR